MQLYHLPLFQELVTVFNSHSIKSWQMLDFWIQIKAMNIQDSRQNYLCMYRLIHRLVKEGYLNIDVVKNKYSQRTYTGTNKLQNIVDYSLVELTSIIGNLIQEKEKFHVELEELFSEIQALNDLKNSYPSLGTKIEDIKFLKQKEYLELNSKIKAIESLVNHTTFNEKVSVI